MNSYVDLGGDSLLVEGHTSVILLQVIIIIEIDGGSSVLIVNGIEIAVAPGPGAPAGVIVIIIRSIIGNIGGKIDHTVKDQRRGDQQ